MLEVNGVSCIFGGVTALDRVSFRMPEGRITGVIGPNGAGKTTLFNIMTGIYTQTSGSVLLGGADVSGLSPSALARRGLVRTFQNIELFGSMTVRENVMVGMHTRSTSGILSCALKLPWCVAEERRIGEGAMKWLDFTGIADLAEVTAGNLPFGKGRLLEIARALAAEPKVILMDEPAAGLNNQETLELSQLIQRICDLGITVVLVEHDMDLVMGICERVVVLNLGKKLAEGTAREIQDHPEVVAAYLGEDH